MFLKPLFPVRARQPSPPLFCRNKRGGFALLITITLLAFLVLLLVSLASLTRVETQVASNSQQLSHARQNALLALNIAIGHLQQATGPDQRFTARADLTSGGSPANPHLTGVWTSAGGVPVLRTWLVSGNQGSTPLAFTPSTPAGADAVALVGEASVASVADQVKLPRQNLSVASSSVPGLGSAAGDVVIGHYAYWIGDQGQKASVSLHDQSDELTYDNTQPAGPVIFNAPASGENWSVPDEKHDTLRQLAPPRPRTEKIFPSLAPDSTPTIPRILAYPQLSLSGGATATELRSHFHDATALAKAVLVDHTVADGGLRKDLSDSPDIPVTAIKNYLRERPATLSGLRAFHAQKRAETPTGSAFPLYAKGPVLTECLVRFQFFRNSAGNLALKYEIQAELWNPWSATLNGDTGGLILRFPNLPVVTVTAGATTTSVDIKSYITDIPVDSALTWTPGQIRTVKGGGGAVFKLSPTGAARSVAVTPATPLPAGPIAGGIQVTGLGIPASAPFTVELRNNGSTLGFYRPAFAFTEPSVPPANTTPDSNAGFLFGYAFDFRDDIGYWTDGSGGTPADPHQDPRRTNLGGAFHETSFPYWDADPSNNIGDINGAGTDTFNATKAYAVFELPRQDPVSIGSLQHVAGEKPFMLGNTWGGAANDYFDQAFLSTLPRWASWNPLSPPPFPNRYISVWLPDPASPPAVGDPLGGNGAGTDYLLDRTHAAKYLMIRGAFNINSTSAAAWRAVLGGASLPSWSYGGASPATASLDNAVFRFGHSAQEFSTDPATEPTAAGDEDFKRGVRTLSDTQLSAMAASIVSSLRARGSPFPSLRDFVNSGILATAIADAAVNPAGVRIGSPGWLSQADLLTALAPFITPRSDTFLIRAYGDVTNPVTGVTEGRTWCEATVQRVPDLTAPASGTYNANDPLAPNAAKYPFGRAYKIISFRWLTSSDI